MTKHDRISSMVLVSHATQYLGRDATEAFVFIGNPYTHCCDNVLEAIAC